MKLEFLPSAYECYRSIKETEPETAGRIKSYLIDALSHPMSGMGEPTALEGKYKGLWKRSLSICDSIYYSFNSEVVTVVALS